MTCTGYLLVLALITIPMGLILLRLVISGLIAVVGFLLMLVIGLVFLVFWPIPGWFRQLGTRYWVYTLGLELQALFITVVISGVMVTSTIISTQIGKYGFFVVALLNLGLFFAAMKARSWLEMLTTFGGAGAMGFAAVLMMRSAARTAARAGSGIVGGGLGLAGAGLRGLFRRPGGSVLPGFKPGSWLNRQRPATVPPENDTEPMKATATRMRPGGDLVRYRPPGRIDDGTHPGQAAYTQRRTFVVDPDVGVKVVNPRTAVHTPGPPPVDKPPVDKLTGRVTRIQEKSGRSGRVWVDAGQGFVPVEPGPKPARRRGGAYRITTARRPLINFPSESPRTQD
jgi:hypothetical protein